MPRPTVARIYPRRLQHNLARVRELTPRSRVMACIKADGYGHGLLDVARALDGRCDAFAVATLEEAQVLRAAGVDAEVLLLEGVHTSADWHSAANHKLSVAVTDLQQIQWLEAEGLANPPRCWVKVDTGMHRLGLAPAVLRESVARLRAVTGTAAELTLMTHFSQADEPDHPATREQLEIFRHCTRDLHAPRSAANSAAILSLPDSHLDWVRPGYMLYGGSPFTGRSGSACGLRPAMDFRSAIISLREVRSGESVGYGGRWVARRPSLIATVGAGYGDGYPRHARDGTPVLVRGQRAPLAGRVSMDMITVDVSDLPRAAIGDPVMLWGEGLSVDEVARCADTIGYELLAGMPRRVPREVCDGE